MRAGISPLVVGCALFASSCDSPQSAPDAERGAVGIRVSTAQLIGSDVDAVQFSIVSGSEDCSGTELATSVASLRDAQAVSVADALFVLPPGSYRACAQPLKGAEASPRCGQASAVVDIVPGSTEQLSLVSACSGAGNGGLSILVELNEPPSIEGLTLDPGKTLTVCEKLHITADVSDPEQGPVQVAWELVSGADTSHIEADGAHLTFWGPAGEYEIKVTATDEHGAANSLTFPVSIVTATCAVPENVQAIFSASCAPCHTANAAGGLRLEPATTAYAALVGVPSSAAACSTRTRVVAGDAANSYLLDKLDGTPDICGAQMPRGRPALPASEIEAIAAWIDDLPY